MTDIPVPPPHPDAIRQPRLYPRSVTVTAKRSVEVKRLRASEDAVAVLRGLESLVEDEFAENCRQYGIAVEEPEFVWVCVMKADGVATGGEDLRVP